MITLDTISSICSAMAWSSNVVLATPSTKFEVNLYLPFPFYEALNNELHSKMSPDNKETLRFVKLELPTGITVHLHKSEGKLSFEPVSSPGKVVDMRPGYLYPVA